MNYENMSNEELLKRYQRDGTIGHELKARLRRCLDMDDCDSDRLRAELAAERAFLTDVQDDISDISAITNDVNVHLYVTGLYNAIHAHITRPAHQHV